MARKFSAVKQVKAMARERIGAPRPGQRINDDLRCRYCRQEPPCMCDEGAERDEPYDTWLDRELMKELNDLFLGECDECGQPMKQDNDGVVYCLECALEERAQSHQIARNRHEQCQTVKPVGKVNYHCQKVAGHTGDCLFGDRRNTL